LSASSRGPSATAHRTSALGAGSGTGIFVTAGADVGRGAAVGALVALGTPFGDDGTSVGGGIVGVALQAASRISAKHTDRRKEVVIRC
jgi:hypothetical protein